MSSIFWPEWEEVCRKEWNEEGGGFREGGVEGFVFSEFGSLLVNQICEDSTSFYKKK